MAARLITLKAEMLKKFRATYFDSFHKAHEKAVEALGSQGTPATLKNLKKVLAPTWKEEVNVVFVLPFSALCAVCFLLPCLFGSDSEKCSMEHAQIFCCCSE